MEILSVLASSVCSLAVLFLLAKLVGVRQISEMSFFDYVVGITIGSIAAEMSTNLENGWVKPITAMLVYGVTAFLISVISRKSIKARRILSGTPTVLINRGEIDRKSLTKARMEVNDLLAQARIAGYFNLADIDYAILETTGNISFQPVPGKRPLNPKDFNFSPMREGLYINVIIDGVIMKEDLKYAHVSEKELLKMLKDREVETKNIILATIDLNKQLTIYKK